MIARFVENAAVILIVIGLVGNLHTRQPVYAEHAANCNQIVGTSAGATMTGTSGCDDIFGKGGNDTIKALGGNDLAWGQNGADLVRGNAGADEVGGGRGDDRVDGGGGKDRVLDDTYGSDTDILCGGTGDDKHDSGDGDTADENWGEDGADSFSMDSGDAYNHTAPCPF